jgi:hypothetical protein
MTQRSFRVPLLSDLSRVHPEGGKREVIKMRNDLANVLAALNRGDEVIILGSPTEAELDYLIRADSPDYRKIVESEHGRRTQTYYP